MVRLWEQSPEPYLTGAVNLVPLTNVVVDQLPDLVRRMDARLSAEPAPLAAKFWTATYLLMGLNYSEALVTKLLAGVTNVQESTTYQAILRQGRTEGRTEGREEGLIEGRIAGEQQILIRLGTIKFGTPDATILAAIIAIRDFERLDGLGERILDPDVNDWNSLLGLS